MRAGYSDGSNTRLRHFHLYPGEMDRYADRLNEAAGMSDLDDDPAKMRPDDDLDVDEDEQDEDD